MHTISIHTYIKDFAKQTSFLRKIFAYIFDDTLIYLINEVIAQSHVCFM